MGISLDALLLPGQAHGLIRRAALMTSTYVSGRVGRPYSQPCRIGDDKACYARRIC
jgi:hypothetical protein